MIMKREPAVNITIENEEIRADGQVIGTVKHDLRTGYHPALRVEIGSQTRWFDTDEDDLPAKIEAFARGDVITDGSHE